MLITARMVMAAAASPQTSGQPAACTFAMPSRLVTETSSLRLI
jgi:hypothetical protein